MVVTKVHKLETHHHQIFKTLVDWLVENPLSNQMLQLCYISSSNDSFFPAL